MAHTPESNPFDILASTLSTRTNSYSRREEALNGMLALDSHRAAPMLLEVLEMEIRENLEEKLHFIMSLARELSIVGYRNALPTILNLRDRAEVASRPQLKEEVDHFLIRLGDATPISRLLREFERYPENYSRISDLEHYLSRCPDLVPIDDLRRIVKLPSSVETWDIDFNSGQRENFRPVSCLKLKELADRELHRRNDGGP